MRVAVISDNHGFLPDQINWWEGIDECEVLLICGDIVPLCYQSDMEMSAYWLLNKFKPWAESIPVEKVLFIAGNHDHYLSRADKQAHIDFSKSDKVTYLKHEIYDHISTQDSKVYRFFGTPYCHIFGNWSFMISNEQLANKFNQIPENVDVLFTHDPPRLGTVDTILQNGTYNFMKACGNEPLAQAVLEKKPRFVCSGHIHSGSHKMEEINNTNLVNCSIVDESYRLVYSPIIFNI